ncbi:unnamed protein product [Adineta steineri]|uniref:Uncharacterized protein n=1 Tax=Adineta steineri TaxID=433720 RepID=A0A819LH63_9BILA|nr:unnamed protein product [Adineta steineri]CAF3964190.1 unnamed protein product [Adineta steineri]
MANMIKVWFKCDQNVPGKIKIDPDSDIDDLKEAIFGATDKRQYQATYDYKPLRPSAKVPQDTTDDMPIVFIKIGNVPPLESQEFAALDRYSQHPYAKCYICRDWHFTGGQDQWNWVCDCKNWEKGDKDYWRYDNGWNLITKRYDSGAFSRYYHHLYNGYDAYDYYNRHACLCEKH